MRALGREAMEAGELGLSTGLLYAPGCFTTKEELSYICKAIFRYNPIYTSHIRNEGNHLIESVQEALDIAEAAGACHDVYPYTASSTTIGVTLPPSYVEMDVSTFLKNLKGHSFVEQLEQSIMHPLMPI